MSVNLGLAQVSGDFLVAAIVIYSLAVIGFAGDFAFGRPRRATVAGAAVTSGERAAQLATVGAAQGTALGASAGAAEASGVADKAQAVPAGAGTGGTGSGDAGSGDTGSGDAVLPARQVPALRAIWEAGPWVRAAVAFSALGILLHVVAVVTRGFAVHRTPWGNMYEFVTALTCVAAIFFCYVMVRYRAWALGVFVMGAVVVALGLAETVIYTAAGPLVPALQSYWLSIHVTAMTLATGIFFVAAVLGVMYLVTDRYRERVAAGKAQPGNGLLARIPSPAQLDKLTYRTVVFGFPVWTFGVIAGAIWADQAWGRYWGWDPVETWAFITWVLYACYLHARATGGWRGRRSHYIQLLGFASLTFNMLVVQVFITGMHSYAGVG
ncbi:MAG: c-type cytochrome biogenesis protein CcsB [Trebonia sp.]|uniref:c-type cytochrome biogenesis protein CcsB n=1 Tax=Trebonia sp. TaxID=2767075 RepID=UPI003BB01B64